MKVRKAVITAAGKGTRMKHITSVLPKGLLPLFVDEEGRKVTVPVIDLILGSLTKVGVENFCLVVGRNGRILMDYLFELGLGATFEFQREPKGFGDAVLRAEKFVGNDPFFVHADDGVLSSGYERAAKLFEEREPDAVLLVRKVSNPKRYGIVEARDEGEFMGSKLLRVLDAQEKPSQPRSDLAVSAAYVFKPSLFKALREVESGEGELELTYGISGVLRNGGEVWALLLQEEVWLNVGDPDSYIRAMNYTHQTSLPSRPWHNG